MFRVIKTLADVQKFINQILDWQANYPAATSWDFKGNRITNAGNSKDPQDYVTKAELAAVQALITQQVLPDNSTSYTAVFTPPDGVLDGAVSPAFVPGIERNGKPNQVWLSCTGAPSGGPLEINVQYNGNKLLTADLEIPAGSTATVASSTFNLPTPTLATLSSLNAIIVHANGATGISIGLVVKIR